MVEYAYDIPGIRTHDDYQMGLQMRYENSQDWGTPLYYSVRLSYLKHKMKEHRLEMVEAGHNGPAEYRIVDTEGKVYFARHYEKDEFDGTKKRPSQSKYKFDFDMVTDLNDPLGYYYVIKDENGKCLTNIDLMMFLRDSIWRDRIEMTSYMKPIAYISTYLPSSIEDFKSAYGFGEKLSEKYGGYFLDKIKEYSQLKEK